MAKGKRRKPSSKWRKGRKGPKRGAIRTTWAGVRAVGRGGRRVVVDTVALGKWANTKRVAYRDGRRSRLQDRTGASSTTATVGNIHRPDRDPLRTSSFERRRHRARWWSRNIHYSADGTITTTPTPAYTRHGRIAARAFDGARDKFIRAAERRAERDRRLGVPRDRAERAERRAVLRRERGRRLPQMRTALVCSNCPPPLNRFKTVAELNRHFREQHMEAGEHGRATGEGAPRGMPNRPQGRHRAPDRRSTTPSRRRIFVVGGRNDPRQAGQERTREAVMAAGSFADITAWGDHVPEGTGAMREDFAMFEALGAALAEAVEAKLINYRIGAGALNGRPIDEAVLAQMQRAQEAADILKQVGPAALGAFDEEYAEDIARAKSESRPEEDWLRQGA